MSVASRPQRQIVSSAASSSVRRSLTSARMSFLNGRASGSSVRGSNSTATKRRARSSDTLRPLPVMITKADEFNSTICDLPSSLTRAGRSVIALARRSDRKAVLLRLSRNRAGLPPISSAATRFSSSSAVAPAVTACGSRPKAMMHMQRASRPFPAPAPDIGAARSNTPGAKWRLGRQTAVNNATRKEDSSRPGALLVSTTATPLGSSNVSASAKQKVLKVSADQLKRGLCFIPRRLLWNESGEIRHILAPHARSWVVAFGAVDCSVVLKQGRGGNTVQRREAATRPTTRDT